MKLASILLTAVLAFAANAGEETKIELKRPTAKIITSEKEGLLKLLIKVTGPAANDREAYWLRGDTEDGRAAAHRPNGFGGDQKFEKLGNGEYRSEYQVSLFKWGYEPKGHDLTIVVYPPGKMGEPTYYTYHFQIPKPTQ